MNHIPHILFVLPALAGGGAERVVIDFMRQYQKSYNVRLTLLIFEDRGELLSDIQDLNIEKIPHSTKRLGNYWRNLNYLRKYIKENNVDLIVTHLTSVSRYILRLKFLGLPRPVIVTEHNNIEENLRQTSKNRWKRFCIRFEISFLYNLSRKIISVSDGVRSQLISHLFFVGWRQRKFVTLYNLINFERIHEMLSQRPDDELVNIIEKHANIAISAGRLVYQKNHIEMIKNFSNSQFSERGCLIILGEGPERDTLEQYVAANSLETKVYLPGFVKNPYWYISRSSLFLLTSHYEGLPTVLIEALTCGTKVITYDCPHGPREIFKPNSENLIPFGDSIKFIEAMNDNQPPEIENDGKAEVLKRFEAANVLANYHGIFMDCIK